MIDSGTLGDSAATVAYLIAKWFATVGWVFICKMNQNLFYFKYRQEIQIGQDSMMR